MDYPVKPDNDNWGCSRLFILVINIVDPGLSSPEATSFAIRFFWAPHQVRGDEKGEILIIFRIWHYMLN